jgi:hypothetical protein
MATRHWTLQLDGETHKVRLEHGYWLGMRQIWIDDKLVERSRNLIDFGSIHPIEIGKHCCELGVTTNGFTYDFYLLLLVWGNVTGLHDALSTAWTILHQNLNQIRLFIIAHVLMSAVGILELSMKTRDWVKQVSNPRVEIVGDISTLNEMNR